MGLEFKAKSVNRNCNWGAKGKRHMPSFLAIQQLTQTTSEIQIGSATAQQKQSAECRDFTKNSSKREKVRLLSCLMPKGGRARKEKKAQRKPCRSPAQKGSAGDRQHVSSRIPAGVCGLQNIGNTCFFNSVVQCLLQSVPLVRYCRSLVASDYIGDAGPVTQSLCFLVQHVWRNQTHVLRPNELFSAVASKYPMFKGLRQQDAQEFLHVLLDLLFEETKVLDACIAEDAKKGWHERLLNIFQGSLRQETMCHCCMQVFRRKESFVDLSLPILESRTEFCYDPSEWTSREPSLSRQEGIDQDCERSVSHEVEDAHASGESSDLDEKLSDLAITPRGVSLRGPDAVAHRPVASPEARLMRSSLELKSSLYYFFRTEELTEKENLYECEKCKTKTPASVRTRLLKAPSTLVLHLKRFKASGRFSLQKISSHVSFELTVDLSPFLCSEATTSLSEARYRLFGISVQSGSLRGGHYIAFVNIAGNNSTLSTKKFGKHEVTEDDESEEGDEEDDGHDEELELSATHEQATVAEGEGDSPLQDEKHVGDGNEPQENAENLVDDGTDANVEEAGSQPSDDEWHMASRGRVPRLDWYYFSDSSYRKTAETEVLAQGAYLLFYERITG